MSESYEEILQTMQEKFQSEAGFAADDASDIGIRLKVLAGEIYSACVNVDWLKDQAFPQTATDNYLDLHASQRGLARKAAIKSSGILSFSRQSALDYDITINEGTICSTASTNGVRFVTTETVVLQAGALSVDAAALAEVGGIEGNVAADTITVLVTPPAGITSVNNDLAFSGGYEKESDEELRTRLLDNYKNIPNGTNAAFYKVKALNYDDVYSASAIARAQGNGTVDVYVAGHGEVCSGTLMQTIEDELNSLREINVYVDVKAPTLVNVDIIAEITVKPGFIADEVIDECEDKITAYFNKLHIGEDVLLADIGEVIYHIDGVANYDFDRISCNDITINDTKLGILRNLTVSEAE